MTKIDLESLHYEHKPLRLMVEAESTGSVDDFEIFAVDPETGTYRPIEFAANVEHVLMLLRYLRFCTFRNRTSATPFDRNRLAEVDEPARAAFWDARDRMDRAFDGFIQRIERIRELPTYAKTWGGDRPWE